MAEKLELELESGSWKRTAKDLVAGAAGGVAQVLLGKHLDGAVQLIGNSPLYQSSFRPRFFH